MKFITSLAVLAVAASSAMAVVPIPIASCTKSVLVLPTDTGCDAFATANGVTFQDLLAWNDKLRPDCLNLDVGFPLCVSITKGACCLVKAVGHPQPNATSSAVPTSSPASSSALPSSSSSVKPSASSSVSGTPSTTNNAAKPSVTNSGTAVKSQVMVAVAGLVLSVAYLL